MSNPRHPCKSFHLSIEDAPLSDLPASESEPLSSLYNRFVTEILPPSADILHANDPWSNLPTENAQCICLRFLRYHLLDAEAAFTHLVKVAHWRKTDQPWQHAPKTMRGLSAGLPVIQIAGRGTDGEALVYSPGRHYMKSKVSHTQQATALKTFFETLLYSKDGPKALSCVVVFDFENMSMRNMDLIATKNGIRIFADFYPEAFKKILVVNYPRWLHGTWRIIKPLLDARTIAKVVWVASAEEIQFELRKYFESSNIPRWLGGDGPDGDMTLLSGSIADADEIARSLQ
eukprot:GFKZ01012648.1.p1 GENE.GFKZ01012648.1~~GFKZ01012648.1.p1  ORF type:complete len:288 (-),score=23.69 GFKZ01012648.1:139-1002(-)